MKRLALSRSAKRKSRDIAALIPIATLFALLPPMVGVGSGVGDIFGVPANVLYIFGVWFGAVALTFWNSRRLDADEIDDPETPGTEEYPP